MNIIRSKDNSIIKHVRKLKIKKTRQENNEYMIEGIRFVEEAVLSRVPIKYCLVSESLSGDRADALVKNLVDMEVQTYTVEDKLIEDICDTQTPQGVVAVVEKKSCDEDELLKKSDFLIIADRLQDPGNLGTIIRSSDAAGVDGIYISDGTVDPYSSKVLRSTMGSVFRVPIIHSDNMVGTMKKIRNYGFTIYVSSLEGSSLYYEEGYLNKTAIVVGNEGSGVDSAIIQNADRLIKIPMPGGAESLNAGVACGIMMFEVVKQRMDAEKNR